MKKFLFLFLFLPSLLFAQTKPVTINGNNADSIVSIKNIYTGVGTPILRWRSPIAKYNGSWMWFDAKNFKYDSISTRNDGTVTGKVMWTDGTGILKFSPYTSLGFIPLAGSDSITGNLGSTLSSWRIGTANNKIDFVNADYTYVSSTTSGNSAILELESSDGYARMATRTGNDSITDFRVKMNNGIYNAPNFVFNKGYAMYDQNRLVGIVDTLSLAHIGYNDRRYAPIGSGGGGVASVTGTFGKIDITGTATNPIINIDPVYVGQNTIQTVGNVNSGAWLATKIGIAYGGTNADLSATGGTGQVLKQSTVGGNVTVGQLATTDLTGFGTNVATALSNTLGASGGVIGNTTSNTLVGDVGFSGTTHIGLKLNNLTTTQLAAISSPIEGYLAENTTRKTPVYYDGTNYVGLNDRTIFNVMDWGAFSDGVTDNKAVVDSIIVNAPTGSTIYFPKGTYFTSAAFRTISKTLYFKGEGEYTVIQCNSTTQDVFVVAGTSVSDLVYYIQFKDLHIRNTSSSAKTAGSGIKMTFCAYSSIVGVTVSNFWNDIYLNNTIVIGITQMCHIQEFTNAGVVIINDAGSGMADFGDSFIDNCLIAGSTTVTATYGIYQTNSGGLKISNCKFIRGGGDLNYGYFYTGTATTVILSITSCSFDSFERTAITINKGTGAFSDITITGNTFEGGDAAYNTIELDGIFGISINGNSFMGQTTNYAIKYNNVTDININNSYWGYNQPVIGTGTNSNISGFINASIRSPYVSSNGGQATFIQSAIGSASQMNLGLNFGGNYSGTAAVSSGRQSIIIDNITGLNRWGIDQNGTEWLGQTSASYGMYCTQAGVANMTSRLSIAPDGNFTTRATNGGSDVVNLLYVTNNTGVTDNTKSAFVIGSGGGASIGWAKSNGTRMINRATILGASTNNTLGSEDGYLEFYTSNAGAGVAAAMRIDQLGNVGIGTSAPTSRLTVESTTSPQFQVSYNSSNYFRISVNSSGLSTLGGNGSIQTSGNVGMGTTPSATAALTVGGTVIIQSYTVATLPTCSAGNYIRATVTDALSPVYDATVVGGGTRVVEVLCNGTTFVCH